MFKCFALNFSKSRVGKIPRKIPRCGVGAEIKTKDFMGMAFR